MKRTGRTGSSTTCSMNEARTSGLNASVIEKQIAIAEKSSSVHCLESRERGYSHSIASLSLLLSR